MPRGARWREGVGSRAVDVGGRMKAAQVGVPLKRRNMLLLTGIECSFRLLNPLELLGGSEGGRRAWGEGRAGGGLNSSSNAARARENNAGGGRESPHRVCTGGWGVGEWTLACFT